MITLLDLRKSLNALNDNGRSWSEIAKELYPYEEPDKMRLLLWKIARDGYSPKNYRTRFQLGLPLIKTMEACPNCNVVHTLGSICPQQQAVDVIIKMGVEPRPMQFKVVHPRAPGKPRLHYKALYLAAVDELNALRRTYAIQEE